MNRDHRDEIEKIRKQRAALAQFGGHALRTEKLDELLQEATALVSDAIEVELVKVLELLPDGQTMLVRAGVNWNPGVVGHATLGSDERSPGGYALKTDEAVISRDVSTETRFEIPPLLTAHGVKSMVNVVIRGKRAAWGVLEVDSRQPRDFDQDDISFLQNYANFLAAAIERLESQRELAAAAKHQELLLRELQHRVMNLLANIRALVKRTSSTTMNVEEFATALDRRLDALARSQQLLTGNPTVPGIREILLQEMEAHGARADEHFTLEGQELALSSRTSQALALVFHELTTNAVKHGALRSKNGRIDVRWGVDPTDTGVQVLVRWREQNTEIQGRPSRTGFGSQVLERSVPQMLGGTGVLEYHQDGIEYQLRFPTLSNTQE